MKPLVLKYRVMKADIKIVGLIVSRSADRLGIEAIKPEVA